MTGGAYQRELLSIHDDVVAEIIRRANARGCLVHYCGQAARCQGDKGQPDLVVAGPFGTAWIEVKMPGDQLKPAQTTWRHMLTAGGQEYHVVGPADLVDGSVDWILRDIGRQDRRTEAGPCYGPGCDHVSHG